MRGRHGVQLAQRPTRGARHQGPRLSPRVCDAQDRLMASPAMKPACLPSVRHMPDCGHERETDA